jgi:hypothetical protein
MEQACRGARRPAAPARRHKRRRDETTRGPVADGALASKRVCGDRAQPVVDVPSAPGAFCCGVGVAVVFVVAFFFGAFLQSSTT